MGANHSSRKASFDASGEVNFDHFQILRAIGKGSFGKVCIVQKKDTKKMYAMKYMNKDMCIQKDAIRNVFREMELLEQLDHPFLVNLWFTFQDMEDMFMVVDLLLGGDLRYHIQQDVKFDEKRVKLYICEIALALEYLQQQRVVHRDIKPDNILLDEEGHVYITDFNIATVLKDGQLATSMSGTKPYMAPELFSCALEECPGYSYPVDWWSLGICAYEMLKGKRPYEIHSGTSVNEVKQLFNSSKVHYPSHWQEGMKELLKMFLAVDPARRMSDLNTLKNQQYVQDMDFDKILRREEKPGFVPPKDHLNCDPTYELEEMIIEAKPLHKKKKRLAKQNSKKEKGTLQSEVDPMQQQLNSIDEQFKPYDREKDQRNKENLTKEALEKQGESDGASKNSPASADKCMPNEVHPDSEQKDGGSSTENNAVEKGQNSNH